MLVVTCVSGEIGAIGCSPRIAQPQVTGITYSHAARYDPDHEKLPHPSGPKIATKHLTILKPGALIDLSVKPFSL